MMQISRKSHFKTTAGIPALFLLSCLAAPALAQNTTSKMDGMKLSSDQPIAIESDQLEVRDQEHKAYFHGQRESGSGNHDAAGRQDDGSLQEQG